jgi:Holliday junction resolvase
MRSKLPLERGEILERRLAEVFRRAGWKVHQEPALVGHADMLVQRGDLTYVVEVKVAAEGRRDRLMPLLAQAILQAQAYARRSSKPVAALAVVGARRVSESLVDDIERFAREFAPDMAVGLIDMEGFQWFQGVGLESLRAGRERAARRLRLKAPEAPTHLFTDLNQWMLKILLALQIDPSLTAAPRGEYRNASELAAAAGVSLMSAFRFIRQLRTEGFLDASESSLKLVRVDALLRRWQAANLRPTREIGVRWVLRGNATQQIREALSKEAAGQGVRAGKPDRIHSRAFRVCLALFAAADALGLGFVHGVTPHIYLERLDPGALQRMGLSVEGPTTSPDVYIRVPAAPESVFRGAVSREGVPVCDVLQIWLDASGYPARGQEQSDMIYRRVLKAMLGKGPQ